MDLGLENANALAGELQTSPITFLANDPMDGLMAYEDPVLYPQVAEESNQVSITDSQQNTKNHSTDQ